jgi:phosphoribosylformylglycinamidine (FGAM) synthase-like enzyme
MGVKIKIPEKFLKKPQAWLFGEDQSRYILTVEKKSNIEIFAKEHKIDISKIGEITGDSINIVDLFSIPVKTLIKTNNKWFKNFVK